MLAAMNVACMDMHIAKEGTWVTCACRLIDVCSIYFCAFNGVCWCKHDNVLVCTTTVAVLSFMFRLSAAACRCICMGRSSSISAQDLFSLTHRIQATSQ
jgi:hypothetical protein